MLNLVRREKKMWKQSDPSEAFITTKLHKNCRLGLIGEVVYRVTRHRLVLNEERKLLTTFLPMDILHSL
jgi:hypothetical protein